MKIVLLDTDTLGFDLDYSLFETFGEVMEYSHTCQEDVIKRSCEAEVLISNKITYTRDMLEQLPKLKLICLTSTGVNTVDLKAAHDCGICVSNIRGYSTNSVVQLTFAMLFSLLMPLEEYNQYVKKGEYIEDTQFKHFCMTWNELDGKTFGIVGLGQIGQNVAKVAKAFGCHVIYYSTSGKNNHSDFERVGFEQMLSQSDIISIHAPLNEQTKSLFDRKAFQRMKPTAILLNLGRGPIVDENDLVEALNEDWIKGAGLDVLEVEPMKKNHPIQQLKNQRKVFITPHVGWASVEARNRMVKEVYQNINEFLQGKPRNQVNVF